MERDILMSKDKKDRRWDGRSRVSTPQYKKNYDDIFKKEQDELLFYRFTDCNVSCPGSLRRTTCPIKNH